MRSIAVSLAAVAGAALLSGCGGSTETTSYTTAYKDLAPSASVSPTPTPSPSPTPTPSPSPTPTPAFHGTPVKGGKVTVTGTEFKFAPNALAAKAGKVEVTLDNKGSAPHEIVFIKTQAAADSLTPGSDGKVPEKGSVGGGSQIDGGQSKAATISVKPGHYVYVCNVPGHYQSGMYGTLVVG